MELRIFLGPLSEPANELSSLYGGGNNSGTQSRNISADVSILDSIKSSVDENAILKVITDQIERLTKAGGSIDSSQSGTKGEIGILGDWMGNILPPNIDQSNLIQAGFEKVTNLLPSETIELLGELSGGLDNFFEELSSNLVGRLASILENFKAFESFNLFVGLGDEQPDQGLPIATPINV